MMKTKFSSRVIALILTLGMLITCFPTFTFAEDTAVAQTNGEVAPKVNVELEKITDLEQYLTDWSKQLYADIESGKTTVEKLTAVYDSYGLFETTGIKNKKLVLDDVNKMIAFKEGQPEAYIAKGAGLHAYKVRTTLTDYGELYTDYETGIEDGEQYILTKSARKLTALELRLYFGNKTESGKVLPTDRKIADTDSGVDRFLTTYSTLGLQGFKVSGKRAYNANYHAAGFAYGEVPDADTFAVCDGAFPSVGTVEAPAEGVTESGRVSFSDPIVVETVLFTQTDDFGAHVDPDLSIDTFVFNEQHEYDSSKAVGEDFKPKNVRNAHTQNPAPTAIELEVYVDGTKDYYLNSSDKEIATYGWQPPMTYYQFNDANGDPLKSGSVREGQKLGTYPTEVNPSSVMEEDTENEYIFKGWVVDDSSDYDAKFAADNSINAQVVNFSELSFIADSYSFMFYPTFTKKKVVSGDYGDDLKEPIETNIETFENESYGITDGVIEYIPDGFTKATITATDMNSYNKYTAGVNNNAYAKLAGADNDALTIAKGMEATFEFDSMSVENNDIVKFSFDYYYPGGNMTNGVEADIFKIYNKDTGKVAARLYASKGANKANFLMIADGLNYDDDYTANEVTNERAMGFPFNTQGTTTANYKASYYIRNSAGNYTNFGIDRANLTGWRMDQAKWQHFDIYLDTINGVYYVMVDNKLLAKANFVDADVTSVDTIHMDAGTVIEAAAYDNIKITELGYHVAFPTSDITVKDAAGNTLVTVQDAEFGRIVALPEINGNGRLTGVFKDAEASAYADRAYNKNGNNSYYGGYIVEPVVGDVTLYATFDNKVSSNANYTLDASGDAVTTRNKMVATETTGTNMNMLGTGNPSYINFADRNWSYTATEEGKELGGFAKISGTWEVGTVDFARTYANTGANDVGSLGKKEIAKLPLFGATTDDDRKHGNVLFINPVTENVNSNNIVLEMANTDTLGTGNKIRMSYDVKIGYLAEATYSATGAEQTVKFGSVMGAVAKNAQGTTLEQNIPVLSMTADKTYGLAVYNGNGFSTLVPANEVTGKWLTIVYDFDTVLKKTVITVKEGETVLETQTVNFLDNNGKQADRITSFVWGANNSTWESSAYLDNFKVEENPADSAAPAVVEPTYLNKVIFHHNGNNLNDWSVRYVADGATATTVGMTANPTKNADTNYSYNFQGWSTGEENQAGLYYNGITNVTKDLEVAPMWEKSTQKYTVTFVDSAEQAIPAYAAQEIQAFTAPTYPGDYTMAATDTTTYVFMGWIAKKGSHIGNKLLNADGTTLFVDFTDATEEELAAIGSTEEVNNIKYTIADFAAMQVTGDSTLKPLFKETYKDAITVNFYNEAGTSVYATRTTGRGMTILNMPDNPTKANTNDGEFQYSWTFDGWYTGTYGTGTKVDPTNFDDAKKTFVGKDVFELYPKFSETKTAVRIVLYNDDNTKLFDGYVSAGNKPNYTAIPKKTSTSNTAYTFVGWKLCDVDGNVADDAVLNEYTSSMTKSNEALPQTIVLAASGIYYYKASYADGEKQYVINFYDNAGAVLKTETVEYTGIANVVPPAVPDAPAPGQYKYSLGAWPYTTDGKLDADKVAAAKAYINAEGNFVVDIYAEYVKTPVENIPDTMETFEDVEITLLPNTNLFAINNSKLITKLGNNGNTATYARNQGDGLAHNVFGIVGEPGNAVNNVLKINNAKMNQAVGTVFYFDPATADSISEATVTYKFKVKNVYETGFPTRFALGLQGQTTAGANRTITNIATDSTTGNLVLTNGAGVPAYMDNPSIGYSVDTKESAGKNTWFDVALTFNFTTNSYQLTIGNVTSKWIAAAETVTNIDRLVVTTGTTAQNLDYTMYIDDLAIEGLKENDKSQFTVSYLSDDNDLNRPVRGTEVVAEGEDAPTAIDYDRSNYGYRLNGWTLDGEEIHTKAKPITNVQANLNPYAVWTSLKSYEVKFYEAGEIIASLPEVYGGYSINSKWANLVPPTPVRGDVTRKVTLDDEYAENDTKYGFEIGTVIPQRQVFKGWALTNDGKEALLDEEGNVKFLDLDEYLVESNLNLMAYFDVEDITYSVKFNNYDGTLVEERIVYPDHYINEGYNGTWVPANNPTRADDLLFSYTFAEWSEDLTDVAITSDKVVYAKYDREFHSGTPYIYEDFTDATADYITYTDANGAEKTASWANVQSSYITKSYGKVVDDYKAPETDPYNKIGTNNDYYFEPLDMSKAENQHIQIQVKLRAREKLSNWNSADIKIKYEGLAAGSFNNLTLGKTIETQPQVFDWITYFADLDVANGTYVLKADGVEIATGTLPDMKYIHGINIGGNFNNWGQIYIDELVVRRCDADGKYLTELPLEEREYTVTYMDADGVILGYTKVGYGEATPAYTGITPGYKAGVEFYGWATDVEEFAKDGIVESVTKNMTLVAIYEDSEREAEEFVTVQYDVSGYTNNSLHNHRINRTYYLGQEVNAPALDIRMWGVSAKPNGIVSYNGVNYDAGTKITLDVASGIGIKWNSSTVEMTAHYVATGEGLISKTFNGNEGSGINIQHTGAYANAESNGYFHRLLGWYTEAPTFDYENGTCTPNGKPISNYTTEYPNIYAVYELTPAGDNVRLYINGVYYDIPNGTVIDVNGMPYISENHAANGWYVSEVKNNFGMPTVAVTSDDQVVEFTVTEDMAFKEITYTKKNIAYDAAYQYKNFNTAGDKVVTYEREVKNAFSWNGKPSYPAAAVSFGNDEVTYELTGWMVYSDEDDSRNGVLYNNAGVTFARGEGDAVRTNAKYTFVAQYDVVATVEEMVEYEFVANGVVLQAGYVATEDAATEALYESLPPTKDGYEFTGWTKTTEGTKVIFTAEFAERDYYIVTFADFDGTLLEEVKVTELMGTANATVDPYREGYVFTGWAKDGEIVAMPYVLTTAEDVTLTATYAEAETFVVTFINEVDGVNNIVDTQEVAYGKSAKLPSFVPVKAGYIFTGWSEDVSVVTGSMAVYAEYKAVTDEVPAENVIYMSSTGVDTNDGSIDAPVKTFKQAYTLVADGGTIVVKDDMVFTSGSWITDGTKNVTIMGATSDVTLFDQCGSNNPSPLSFNGDNANATITIKNINIDLTSMNWGFFKKNGNGVVNVVLENVTVANGIHEVFEGATTVTARDITFVNCGGNQFSGATSVDIDGALFINAAMRANGGSVKNVVFSDYTANNGSALQLYPTSEVLVENVKFTHATLANNRAIYLSTATEDVNVTLNNVEVVNWNTTYNDGPVFRFEGSSTTANVEINDIYIDGVASNNIVMQMNNPKYPVVINNLNAKNSSGWLMNAPSNKVTINNATLENIGALNTNTNVTLDGHFEMERIEDVRTYVTGTPNLGENLTGFVSFRNSQAGGTATIAYASSAEKAAEYVAIVEQKNVSASHGGSNTFAVYADGATIKADVIYGTRKSINVAYEVEGKGSVSGQTQIYLDKELDSVGAVATPENGYVLYGWYIGGKKVSDANPVELTLNGDTTVVAKFVLAEDVSVKNYTYTGEGIEEKSGTFISANPVPAYGSIPEAQDGYFFAGWTATDDGETVTLTPEYVTGTIFTFTQHYLDENGEWITLDKVFPDGYKLLKNGLITPAEIRGDVVYKFVNWSTDEIAMTDPASATALTYPVEVEGNTHVYAIYDKYHTVKYVDIDGETVVVNQADVKKGATTTTNVVPTYPVDSENHTKKVFRYWTVNGEQITLPYTVDANTVIQAYAEDVATKTITFMDGETVIGTFEDIPGQKIVPVTAPIKAGNVFIGWSDGETTIKNSDLANTAITEDATYTAQYMEVNIEGDNVYVSGSGSDSNDGLDMTTPVATLYKAYEVAVASGRDTIYVLTDAYFNPSGNNNATTIASDIKVIGLADAALIRNNDGGNHSVVINDGVVADFEDITFKFDGKGHPTIFNVLAGSTLKFTNVVATDMPAGYNFTELRADSKVEWTNVTFKDSTVALNSQSKVQLADGSYINGITISNITKDVNVPGNVEITNMVVENITGGARLIAGDNVTIDGYTVRNVVSNSNTYFYTAGANNVISNVTIEDSTLAAFTGTGLTLTDVTFKNVKAQNANYSMINATDATITDITFDNVSNCQKAISATGGTITNVYVKNSTFTGYAIHATSDTNPTTVKNLFISDSDSSSKWSLIHGDRAGALILDGKTIVYTDDCEVAQGSAALAQGVAITENFAGIVTVRNNVGWANAVRFTSDEAITDSALAAFTVTSYGNGSAYYNKETSAWANGTNPYKLTYVSSNETAGTVIGGTNVSSEFGKVNAVVFPAEGYILAQFEDAEGNIIPATKVATTDAAFEGEEIYTLTVSASGEITAVFMDEDEATMVEFFDYDGSLLDQRYYVTGAEITAPADPTRESVNGVVYEFLGWATEVDGAVVELGVADAPKTFYAVYGSTQTYDLVFMNGEEVLYEVTVNAGAAVEYVGEEPTKVDDTLTYRYDFIGWNTDPDATEAIELGTATESATYYAIFERSDFSWKVTFVNYDGTELAVDYVANNGTAEYTGETPVREGAGYIYTFNGWDTDLGPITADTVITAKYTRVKDANSAVYYDEDFDGLAGEFEYQYANAVTSNFTTSVSSTSANDYSNNFAINAGVDFPVDVELVADPKDDSNTVLKHVKSYNGAPGATLRFNFAPFAVSESPKLNVSFRFMVPEGSNNGGGVNVTLIGENGDNGYTKTTQIFSGRYNNGTNKFSNGTEWVDYAKGVWHEISIEVLPYHNLATITHTLPTGESTTYPAYVTAKNFLGVIDAIQVNFPHAGYDSFTETYFDDLRITRYTLDGTEIAEPNLSDRDYTVTFTAGYPNSKVSGENTIALATQNRIVGTASAKKGETVVFDGMVPGLQGKRFKAWTDGKNEYALDAPITVNGNMVLEAVFEDDANATVKVVYQNNDNNRRANEYTIAEGNDTAYTMYYAAGTVVKLPASFRRASLPLDYDSYTGWNTANNDNGVMGIGDTYTIPASDVTLYARTGAVDNVGKTTIRFKDATGAVAISETKTLRAYGNALGNGVNTNNLTQAVPTSYVDAETGKLYQLTGYVLTEAQQVDVTGTYNTSIYPNGVYMYDETLADVTAVYDEVPVEEGKIAIYVSVDGVNEWRYYTVGEEVNLYEGLAIVDTNTKYPYRVRNGATTVYNADGTTNRTLAICTDEGAENAKVLFTPTAEDHGRKLTIGGMNHMSFKFNYDYYYLKNGAIVHETGVKNGERIDLNDNNWKNLWLRQLPTAATITTDFATYTFKGWKFTNLIDANDPNNFANSGAYFVQQSFLPTGVTAQELYDLDYNVLNGNVLFELVADYEIVEADYVTINFVVEGNDEPIQTVKWYRDSDQAKPGFSGNAAQLVKKADLVTDENTTKYTFASWIEGEVEPGTVENEVGVITFTANFNETVYATVTTIVDEVETVTEYKVGTNVTIAEPTKEHEDENKLWVFTGWTNENDETVTVPFSATVNTTLTANFEEKTSVTLTFVVDGEVVNTVKAIVGETINVPFASYQKEVDGEIKVGAGWLDGEEVLGANIVVTEAKTYELVWGDKPIEAGVYVSEISGNDSNSGTEFSAPVKTVAQAITKVTSNAVTDKRILVIDEAIHTCDNTKERNKAGFHYVGISPAASKLIVKVAGDCYLQYGNGNMGFEDITLDFSQKTIGADNFVNIFANGTRNHVMNNVVIKNFYSEDNIQQNNSPITISNFAFIDSYANEGLFSKASSVTVSGKILIVGTDALAGSNPVVTGFKAGTDLSGISADSFIQTTDTVAIANGYYDLTQMKAITFDGNAPVITGYTATEIPSTFNFGLNEKVYSLEVATEEPTTYTITFVVGETRTEVPTVEGEVPVFADPNPEEGYEFAGWEAEDGTVYKELPEATADATYTAKFNTVAPELFEITFEVDGEVVYTWGYEIGEKPVYNGDAEHLEKVGYTFKGWSAEENGAVIEGELPAVTGVTTYYAIFAIKTYTITFKVAGQDDVVKTVEHGQMPSYGESDPVVDGYEFKGWSAEENGTVIEGELPAATANATYYAILEEITSGGDTTPVLWGDVNCDGIISILDSTAILTYVSIKSGTYGGYALGTTYGDILWGDVNQDGIISILDSTAILTYVSIKSGTYGGYALGTTYDLVMQ